MPEIPQETEGTEPEYFSSVASIASYKMDWTSSIRETTTKHQTHESRRPEAGGVLFKDFLRAFSHSSRLVSEDLIRILSGSSAVEVFGRIEPFAPFVRPVSRG